MSSPIARAATSIAMRGAMMTVMLIGLGGSLTQPAAALDDKVKRACKGDYHRLCPSYKVGSSQLRACMEAKQNDISWNCIQALMDSGEVDKQRVAKSRR